MVRIGVDLGITPLNTTAIAVLHDNGFVETFIYPGPFNGKWHERVGAILSWAVGILVKYNGHIESLNYENVFYGVNKQVPVKLASIGGGLILIGRQMGVSVTPVSTSQAKKAVSGKGNTSKEEVFGIVSKALPSLNLTYHEADAIAVALVGGVDAEQTLNRAWAKPANTFID